MAPFRSIVGGISARRGVAIFGALSLVALATLGAIGVPVGPSSAEAQRQRRGYDQTVLGPGLYSLQTRVTDATCNDDSATGFVSTYIGSIDGVPGSRSMVLKLINNRYWTEWAITVGRNNTVTGRASVEGQQREYNFEVRRQEGRWVGTGARSYFTTIDGERRRCTVNADVLLRRFDVQ